MALVAAGTLACPGPELLGNRGIAIGHTGGTGTGLLAFRVQPRGVTAGNIMTPAVQVQIQDTLGNVDTSFTASVTIAIGTNPVGGRLSGTTSVAPVNGVALFGDLALDKAGTGSGPRQSRDGLHVGRVGVGGNGRDQHLVRRHRSHRERPREVAGGVYSTGSYALAR